MFEKSGFISQGINGKIDVTKKTGREIQRLTLFHYTYSYSHYLPIDCKRLATDAANLLSPPRSVVNNLYIGPLSNTKINWFKTDD